MKNRAAALGAAFLLLASVLFCPSVRVLASAAYTSLINVWLQNSKIDSTPIGQSVQASGQFTNLYSTGGAVNAVVGNVTPNVGTFTTATATTFSGALSGNATTATNLQSSPTQCGGGTVATGIAANGNANCTTKGAVTGTQVLLPNQSLCTPATSTDSQCSGSITFSSLGDANYTVSVTTYDTAGAQLSLTMTGKSATGFNYVLTCTFFCSTFNGPAADIRVFHP